MISRRAVAVVLALTMTAGACGDGDGDGDAAGRRGGTLVLAQLTGPMASLDPALGSTVVVYVNVRPVLETLVTVRPGGTELVPLLATSWKVSPDGQTWTFRLRTGVHFHDGTPFDAAAVCFNFERWYQFRGLLQHLATEWTGVFGGFATQDDPSIPKESRYRSCTAPAHDEVVIGLTRPSGALLSALAVPAFAIASPTALRRYEADKVTGTVSEPKFEGSFGTRHLVGTGPFRLERYDVGDKVVLARNPTYWGSEPALDRVIVRKIDDPTARRQALESGEVQAILPVPAAHIEPLRRAGFGVYEQPGVNLGFVGFNRARPPLDNPKIREAVAHALDRQKVVRAKYQASATMAHQIVPPGLWGHAEDVRVYRHDPDRARMLVAESGVADPVVELWYGTGLPEGPPALPDAEGTALSFKADLEAVGFSVTAKPTPFFPNLVEALRNGSLHLFLGDLYAFRLDPAVLFEQLSSYQPSLGPVDADLKAVLDQADGEVEQAARAELYGQASRIVSERLPLLPFVHVKPAVAYAPNVAGYRPSPIPWEGLVDVHLTR